MEPNSKLLLPVQPSQCLESHHVQQLVVISSWDHSLIKELAWRPAGRFKSTSGCGGAVAAMLMTTRTKEEEEGPPASWGSWNSFRSRCSTRTATSCSSCSCRTDPIRVKSDSTKTNNNFFPSNYSIVTMASDKYSTPGLLEYNKPKGHYSSSELSRSKWLPLKVARKTSRKKSRMSALLR